MLKVGLVVEGQGLLRRLPLQSSKYNHDERVGNLFQSRPLEYFQTERQQEVFERNLDKPDSRKLAKVNDRPKHPRSDAFR